MARVNQEPGMATYNARFAAFWQHGGDVSSRMCSCGGAVAHLTALCAHATIRGAWPPSSSGLGHSPFKAATGIRIPLGALLNAPPYLVWFFCASRKRSGGEIRGRTGRTLYPPIAPTTRNCPAPPLSVIISGEFRSHGCKRAVGRAKRNTLICQQRIGNEQEHRTFR